MPIFKPKERPFWQWSRLVHFLVAALITALGGNGYGYEGAVCAGFGSIATGFGWEVSNRYTKGWHMYGDALDFWAFVAGALVVGVGYVIQS